MRKITLSLLGVSLILLTALFLDARTTEWARNAPSALIDISQYVTRLGDSVYVFIVSSLIFFLALALRWREDSSAKRASYLNMAESALFIFSANLIAGIAVQLVKHLVGRARPPLGDPATAFNFVPFSFKTSMASFPSGHTVTAFATAVAISYICPKLRWPLFIIAACVGASRVILRAHYPSDVLAGAMLGSIVAYSVYYYWSHCRQNCLENWSCLNDVRPNA